MLEAEGGCLCLEGGSNLRQSPSTFTVRVPWSRGGGWALPGGLVESSECRSAVVSSLSRAAWAQFLVLTSCEADAVYLTCRCDQAPGEAHGP